MNPLRRFILFVFLTSSCLAHATIQEGWTHFPYAKISALFHTTNARKMIVSLELKRCGMEEIRSAETIKECIAHLSSILAFKNYAKPQLIHCNDTKNATGYAFSLLTEQGTLWGEFINQENSAFLTLCSNKAFNPFTLMQYIKNHFKAASATIVNGMILQ